MDLRPCGEGFAYAAADPAIRAGEPPADSVKSSSGSAHRRHARQDREGARDFRRRRDRALWFGLWRRASRCCSTSRRALSRTRPNAPAGLAPARVDGLPVTDWQNNEAPKFKGVKIGLDELRKGSRARDSARSDPASLWGRTGMSAPSTQRASRLWKQDGSGRSLRRRLQRGRPAPRRRLWRRHDPLAAGIGRRGAARAVRRRTDAPLGRLDADRLLHGLAGRRGSDRLAYQSRLDARGRFLPRLALLRALQPARHRATRAEDARRGDGGQAGERKGQAQARDRADRDDAAAGHQDRSRRRPRANSQATPSRWRSACARPPACRSTASTH